MKRMKRARRSLPKMPYYCGANEKPPDILALQFKISLVK